MHVQEELAVLACAAHQSLPCACVAFPPLCGDCFLQTLQTCDHMILLPHCLLFAPERGDYSFLLQLVLTSR